MGSGASSGGSTAETPVSVTTEIEDGRTIVTVSGARNVIVVVNSASGERVYLPPGETNDAGESSPYRPTDSSDSPYEGIADDSPYGSRPQPDATLGVNPTANGFRLVHPEPADDVRFLR
ncbi:MULTISPECIES: hypothetical protein [unclassified Halorhabdus]|uniref:DUF7510 family protein n=1 Tax=unclassified Halorhabdus TaxID=2621901 RepID=UPI0023DBACB8|nr:MULTISPECIES: hypothetical protein [unclassified Halorhabdus]WEL16738.1 Uncharacterized protein SVXHr_0558 [Halorhabdus sp. SVX81]WEL20609.1 Uncharacterized protein HBNXHr_0535 [Halorhabdus sp. BNX81]